MINFIAVKRVGCDNWEWVEDFGKELMQEYEGVWISETMPTAS